MTASHIPLPEDLRTHARHCGSEMAAADVATWDVTELPAAAIDIIREDLDGDLAALAAADELAAAGDTRLQSDHHQAQYAWEWEAAYLARLASLIEISPAIS